MKTRIIFTLALLAGILLCGCSREELPGDGVPGNGNRVVFTLAGITPQKNMTRATGDNTAAKPDASVATDAEKQVTSLIAAAYEKQSSGEMGFYNAFDVTITDDGCSFDIAKEGRFDLYLIANADPTLAAAIKTLGTGSPVTELEEKIVEQVPDADNAFVMTTPEALKLISYSGETADCGEVSLRRLSVRIDLLNKAEGLTITKVTFRNRAMKSQLFTPNAMISGEGTVEDREYADLNLEGNFDTPAEYKSEIYSYENLSRRDEATMPTLDIEYTYQGQPYTHTVEFLDKNDPEGLAPLALKRNHLYRVTVGRKLEPEFEVEVLDWQNEESFQVDDIPFQAQMNAKLAVKHFADANVATIDENKGIVTFTTTDPNNTSAYVAWNPQWATAVYHGETDGAYYRVPTKDEMYLLFPDTTHPIRFDQAMDGATEITETLSEKLFDSETVNGGEGQSRFKNATKTSVTAPAYPIIYAIRFKGTAQCAAYRYEVKNSDQPATGELEIRIKALQPNSLLTIDEVADEAYWGHPDDGDSDAENQLVYHIAATGYKETIDEEVINQGTNSFLWTSTEVNESDARDAGHHAGAALVSTMEKINAGTLRLVKASAEEVQDADQTRRNAALKVNMFTAFNVKSADLGAKKVNSFYDKLAVSLADCPTDSYFTYTELKDAGLTAADAVLTDGEGNKYRLPTEGELNLLLPMYTEEAYRATVNKEKDGIYHPWWNDNASTNTFPYVTVETPFTETIYLKNGADNLADKTHADDTDSEYTLKGQSQLKVGTQTETVHYYTGDSDDPEKYNYNVRPVYGLRFKGTNQYAAYRWETCKIAGNPLERYLSIKIKALKKDDTQTTIDEVADEAFWADGFIEFKFPASGYYAPNVTPDTGTDNISYRGVGGYCWASSLWDEAGTQARCLHFGLSDAGVSHLVVGHRFPLRLVRVQE